MKDLYLQCLSKLGEFSSAEINSIYENTFQYSFKRGTLILEEGKISKMCYFVVNGCVRQYQLVNGEEKSLAFFMDEEAVISYNSYIDNTPSTYSLSCIEDSILIGGTREQEENLKKIHPRLNSLTQIFMKKDFTKAQERLASFVNNSPEERYQLMLTHQPELLQRVPLQYLASYIGVTPESFSRIRKRVLLQEKNRP